MTSAANASRRQKIDQVKLLVARQINVVVVWAHLGERFAELSFVGQLQSFFASCLEGGERFSRLTLIRSRVIFLRVVSAGCGG
jgi:hypothetical protein